MGLREEFFSYLGAVRSSKTVETYCVSAIKHFDELWEGKYDQISSTALAEYVEKLCREGYSASSVRTYSAGIAHYLRWMRVNKGIPVPEQVTPVRPKIEKVIKRAHRDEDLEKFLAAAGQIYEPFATAIRMLPLSGLRCGEMVKLQLDDVIVRKGFGFAFLLHGTKSRKDRLVPVLPAGVPVLSKYLKTVRPAMGDSPWLWPNRQMKGKGEHIAIDRLQAWVGVLRKATGIQDITSHTLRHVYASTLAEHGVPVLKIMEMMGHENLSTTQGYVHFRADDLLQEVSRVDVKWMGGKSG